MKKILILIALLLVLIGCKTTKYAPSENRQSQDSTYVAKNWIDSILNSRFKEDSVYVRDSVYLHVKGDTVTKFVTKYEYRYKYLSDTIYRNTVRRDTLYLNRADSIRVERPIEVAKPLKWYNQGFLWLGKLCCIAILFWIIFLYLKRRR